MIGNIVALLAFFTPFRRLDNWKTTLKVDPKQFCGKEKIAKLWSRIALGILPTPRKWHFCEKFLTLTLFAKPGARMAILTWQSTSFFSARLPFFASFFLNRRCSFYLCFGQRWQVSKQKVISALAWKGNIEIATTCFDWIKRPSFPEEWSPFSDQISACGSLLTHQKCYLCKHYETTHSLKPYMGFCNFSRCSGCLFYDLYAHPLKMG